MIENTISIDNSSDTEAEKVNALLLQHNKETAQQDIGENEESAVEKDCTDNGKTLPAGQEPAEDEQEKPSEETVELTLYGEKVQLAKSQALAAAQKGMAFEHIKGQLSAAKNDVRLKTLENIAAMKGQTIAAFIGDLQHRAMADDIAAKYGGIENAPTQVLSEAVRTLEQSRISLEQREAQARQHHVNLQLMEFLEKNPGVKEIPQEVMQLAEKGENIALAYSRFNENRLAKELSEAKRELEMIKSEEKAKRSSTPTAMNSGAANESRENEFLKLMKSTW
ncbi:MAG: hypothetical protein E7484_01870 [Ruminococcaceae bacterium]|nr:hypothetical protein [Oscillospiraceae bacterium]